MALALGIILAIEVQKRLPTTLPTHHRVRISRLIKLIIAACMSHHYRNVTPVNEIVRVSMEDISDGVRPVPLVAWYQRL